MLADEQKTHAAQAALVTFHDCICDLPASMFPVSFSVPIPHRYFCYVFHLTIKRIHRKSFFVVYNHQLCIRRTARLCYGFDSSAWEMSVVVIHCRMCICRCLHEIFQPIFDAVSPLKPWQILSLLVPIWLANRTVFRSIFFFCN